MITVARFLQDYPSFKRTAAELITKRIAAATKRINVGVWGDMANDGIMALAAHMLSVSPDGEQVRLKKENRVTTYQLEWERMRREVTVGVGRVS